MLTSKSKPARQLVRTPAVVNAVYGLTTAVLMGLSTASIVALGMGEWRMAGGLLLAMIATFYAVYGIHAVANMGCQCNE